ncbi:MAG: 16S rRNA (guanine(966)-N(2))-methyltransferase RsmD [Rhodospirillaceae bacterium]
MPRFVAASTRLVAGSYRGRILQVPPGSDVRPTAGRTREAMFNILAHPRWSTEALVPGACVLDAFCGSGALGLEALSRGASTCLFLDVSQPVLECVRANIAALGEEKRATLLRADATKPPPARISATLAFLDPPYRQDRAVPALAALTARGWFAPGATVIVETDSRDQFTPPPLYVIVDQRRYGHTALYVMAYTP